MSVNKNPQHVPCALQKEDTCGNLSRLLAGEQNQTAAQSSFAVAACFDPSFSGLAEVTHPLSLGFGVPLKMLGKLPNSS